MSNTREDDFGDYGATAIDALPTLIAVGKEDVVLQILHLIAEILYFIAEIVPILLESFTSSLL